MNPPNIVKPHLTWSATHLTGRHLTWSATRLASKNTRFNTVALARYKLMFTYKFLLRFNNKPLKTPHRWTPTPKVRYEDSKLCSGGGVSQDPHPPSTPLIRRGVVRPPPPLLTPSALHFFCTSKSIFQKKSRWFRHTAFHSRGSQLFLS